jgi:polyferredoxin
MDKMGYPKGLIRYSTENAVAQGLTQSQTLARVLRPRVFVYTSILGAVVIAAALSLWLRVPLKVDVIRDRAAISREVEGGLIENVYRLQIMNTTEAERRFEVRAAGLPGIHVVSEPSVAVGAAASRMVPVRVRVPPGAAPPGTHAIEFVVSALDDDGVAVREKSVFIVR